jgi:ADP-L-glycero-D-manno-heptose 6-epimerase
MRALVTGATGFVGSAITNYLNDNKWEVFYTGTDDENYVYGEYVGYNFDSLPWCQMGQIDVLFHQAAITDTMVHDREEMFRVNFWNSRKLIDQAIDHGVKHIVYASSAAVYGDNMPPFREDEAYRCLNVYGESKLLLDRYCNIVSHNHPDVSIIGLRYSNVYGPGENHKPHTRSMILQMYQQMLDGNCVVFEFGEQKRDFVYIKDVLKANMLAARAEKSGVYNVGSGAATSFNSVYSILNRLMGGSKEIRYKPNTISKHFQNHTQLDLQRSREDLGYEPDFPIEKGISDYMKHLSVN